MSTLVLDVGRSNVKCCLVDHQGEISCRFHMENRTRQVHAIDVFETGAIWQWFLRCLTEVCKAHQPDAIVATTHGASAMLMGPDDKLLDLLDYESSQYHAISSQYDGLRDDYGLTGSPNLPNGLNLGRQIYWLQEQHPQIFNRARSILLYPQYWAYLLSGAKVTEVTSLGTHTDLWHPEKRQFSNLVNRCHWQDLFPPFMDAWQTVGYPLANICQRTGLNPDCKILCGIHDSNATFAYHFQANEPMTLLSTGTWVIGMYSGEVAIKLKEENDELLNVNLLAEPISSFRFMGGREWQWLADDKDDRHYNEKPQSETDQVEPGRQHLISIIQNNVMALPAFNDQGGPFRNRTGKVTGQCRSQHHKKALASLYCAQVSAWCLQRFSATGRIIIDGPFIRDKIFLAVLSQLLPDHRLFTSNVTDGTSLGAARLAIWPETFSPTYRLIDEMDIPDLQAYHRKWLTHLDAD